MKAGEVVHLGREFYGQPDRPRTTREWLESAHHQMAQLLPRHERRVMLTGDLIGEAEQPVDVYRWFRRDPGQMTSLLGNFDGILHTAQSVCLELYVDKRAPPWTGFEDVWIPVDDDVQVAGRIGFAETTRGRATADCIVILPGYLGDNGILRSRDLAIALRNQGFHVLALEMRGHGQTEHRFPDAYYTFGVLESQDLLRVSRWLQDKFPCVRDTGLIGFCWGGNLVMLAAWLDGAGRDHPSVSRRIRLHLEPPTERRHYAAGIMAFSPVLDWEDLIKRSDVDHTLWDDPNMFFFQDTVRYRLGYKRFGEISGNLRRLIAYEYARSPLGPSLPVSEAYRFLRFLQRAGRPADAKLESVRVPLLLVAAVNDPFLDARRVAELISPIRNPNVAALVLHGGGHIGFGPYNRAYFYSLVLNYFNAETGAAAGWASRGR